MTLLYLPQILGCLSVSMASMSLGTLLGYPTKALPQLRNETDTEVNLNESLGSWYAASFWLVGVIITPLGGVVSGWMGRRKTLVTSAPLVAVGWFITGCATNKTLLFLGRLTSSFSTALHMSSAGVYISEMAHPKIRGSLLVMPGFFMGAGMLYVWTLAYFLSWRQTALASMVPSVLLTVTLAFLPESPYWLVSDNKEPCAKKSLQFFRGPDFDVTEELKEIQEKHESKMEKIANKSWRWTLSQMCSSAFLKPFSVIGVLYILNTWNGFNSIITYMITILEESGSAIDPDKGPMIVGSLRLVTAGLSTVAIAKISPKVLFVTCNLITTASLGSIGIFSYLKAFHGDHPYMDNLGWVPLAMVILLVIMRSIGILPVMHVMLNELYPTEIRTQSIGISQSFFLAAGASGVKLFPDMKNAMGLYGVCACYMFFSLLCTFWGLYKIPDNRGVSLVKVEEQFEEKEKMNV